MIVRLEIEKVIVEQIAKTISAYPFTLSFFSSNFYKDLKTEFILLRVRHGKFESIAECYIDGVKVYIGGCEFPFENMGKELQELYSQEQDPSELTAAFQTLQLTKIKSPLLLSSGKGATSTTVLTPRGKCGSGWEIFDMANLYKVYKAKEMI